MSAPLSVLDVAPVSAGSTSAESLAESLKLAQLAEQLGYTRVWYAEHHNMPSIASTSPELLIARAAMVTERIRLGAGGVMLPNHAPLKVAETYKMLEALHPGRIDLGLGRAPGTDQRTALALRRSAEAVMTDQFPQQLAELLAFGDGSFPQDHPFHPVFAYPRDVALPPIWMLGSSSYGAQFAAQNGVGYAFAAHFSPQPAEGPMLGYRRHFQPGLRQTPYAILAVSVICAETTEEAEFLASSMELVWARLRTGQLVALPSPEDAQAHRWTDAERMGAESYRALTIVGNPEQVRDRIAAMATASQADEVMVTTMVWDPAARRRSYELLAKAWA